MEFIYDLKKCRSVYSNECYNTFTHDFRRYYVFRNLRSVWNQIALWYDKFMNPAMINRNPKIYIDEHGVIVDCYDGYDYVVESFSINIIKRQII